MLAVNAGPFRCLVSSTEKRIGRARMHRAARINRTLTGVPSVCPHADSNVSSGQVRFLTNIFLNRLACAVESRAAYKKATADVIRLAESAYAFRDLDALETAGQCLFELPIAGNAEIGLFMKHWRSIAEEDGQKLIACS